MKKQPILRPLHAGMNDYYSDTELYDLCEKILFTKAKTMDTALLKEALLALDERPDDKVALHRETVHAKIMQRIQSASVRPRRRLAMVFAILILSLLLVGCGLAIAHHIGVISFPAIVQFWLPWVESNEAESLVQSDLFAATFEHSELRVREASYDGHELRIVYSLRDLRENAALSEQEQSASAIDAARLDGLGSCDYLVVDGQDVYLDDIFQIPGEAAGEMLYYISAIIPGEMDLHDVVSIRMPIGELDLETRTRYTAAFSIDTDLADVYALSAEPVTVQWDNLVVTVTRADFSPLNGIIEIHYSAVDESQPYTHLELRPFTPDGIPIGYAQYSAYGDKGDGQVNKIITQYIPIGEWSEQMVLSVPLADGSIDESHMITLTWKNE